MGAVFRGGAFITNFHFMMNVFIYLEYRSNVYLSVNVLKLGNIYSTFRK